MELLGGGTLLLFYCAAAWLGLSLAWLGVGRLGLGFGLAGQKVQVYCFLQVGDLQPSLQTQLSYDRLDLQTHSSYDRVGTDSYGF